jgi:hypothetical protein
MKDTNSPEGQTIKQWVGRLEVVASLALFLYSEAASFTTE